MNTILIAYSAKDLQDILIPILDRKISIQEIEESIDKLNHNKQFFIDIEQYIIEELTESLKC